MSQANANATFAPRQRIGNYELLVELASGGTATVGIAVYRGAAGFERLVVVKRVHRKLARDREFSAMLLDEARLASSVRHPNVVPVIDVVRTEDEVVLVMEYVEGVSLSELIAGVRTSGGRLPTAVVSRIVIDALSGLHEAHEATDLRRQPLGIVHRDVSPDNVIVGVDGASRVIDFGIAKARSRLAQTRAGMVKGKGAYMAPEQIDGLPVDRRCDVFSSGALLWEALTGVRLFDGKDDFDAMRLVMSAPITPPSGLSPECSPEVDSLVAAALSRAPADRFQTARAFARALEHAIPPAPASAVGEIVTTICGADLERRNAKLVAILGEEFARLGQLSRLSSAFKVPEPAPRPPSDPQPSRPPPPPPVRSIVPTVIAVSVLSVLIGAAAALVWLSR
jgi:eukaryotic-like serine/threonine-protein kinase